MTREQEPEHSQEEQHSPTGSRRGFLRLAGATALGGALGYKVPHDAARAQEKKLPDFVKTKDLNGLIVHSDKTFETKRGMIAAGGITPSKLLFIRNNLAIPDESAVAGADAWEVAIEGVKTPRKLTIAELRTLGVESVAAVLQCSGNGRGYFANKPSGTPWTVGAAGCVIWTGVALKAVVEALGGAAGGARFITGTGGEKLPDGIDPKSIVVERSVPIEALENSLLAWEMNGEPLPLVHGGPLRLVHPGYYGINNVKWVKTVALAEAETEAKIHKTAYRLTPVGAKSQASEPSMWDMSVKSFVTSPSDTARAGKLQIAGVAFGGTRPLARVEVSTDGGATWRQARLIGPDLGKFAWRGFALQAELAPGTHTIVSRATDADGAVQPEAFPANDHGYAHNGWRDPAVKVVIS
jgi:DMSO/TMAO reductase YedYZ molybdopterin-dependent catalytic subunit